MLILASNSTSRKAILQKFHISFEQKSIDFNEDSIEETNPKSFAYQACKGKMQKALQTFGEKSKILVADSVISLNGSLQRQPKDKEEARAMLLSQSNATIHIITAQILKSEKIELCDISQSTFSFLPFDTKDLQEYLDSQLWIGKAGGVMVEGFQGKYILKQNGLLSTAMGLSIEKFLPFFEII